MFHPFETVAGCEQNDIDFCFVCSFSVMSARWNQEIVLDEYVVDVTVKYDTVK